MRAAWPPLDAGALHLWHASLAFPGNPRRLEAALSAEERARAAAFHFRSDRLRFTACRALLRLLIGRYLGQAPARLRFGRARAGKLRLLGRGGDLSFNLSHSGDRALFGFCRRRAIGVDLERLRPVPSALGIAESHFSPNERARFRRLPAERVDWAFLTLWTRKEALLKAQGTGLGRCAWGTEVRRSELGGWTVGTVLPDRHHVGAWAVGGRPGRASLFQLSPAWEIWL